MSGTRSSVYPREVPGIPISCAPCTYGVNVISVATCSNECDRNQKKQGKYSCLYCWEEIRHGINIFILMVAAVITVFIVWWSNRYYTEVHLVSHICLTTVGTILFMTVGILIFAGDHCFGRPYKRKYKSWVHAYFMLIGLALVTSGILVHLLRPGGPVIADEKGDTTEIYTVHAYVGLSAFVAILLSTIYGACAIYHCSGCLRPLCCRCVHSFFGLVGFVLCVAAFCLELEGEWFQEYSTYEIWLTTVTLTGFLTFYSLIAASLTMIYYMMWI